MATKLFRATGTCPECADPATIACGAEGCCTRYCSDACRSKNAGDHAPVCGPLEPVPEGSRRMLAIYRKFACAASEDMVVEVLPCPKDSFNFRIHDCASLPPAPCAIPMVLMPGVTVLMNPPPSAQQIYTSIFMDALELVRKVHLQAAVQNLKPALFMPTQDTGRRAVGIPEAKQQALSAWTNAAPHIRQRFEEKALQTRQLYASNLEQLRALPRHSAPAPAPSDTASSHASSPPAAAAAAEAETEASGASSHASSPDPDMQSNAGRSSRRHRVRIVRPTTCMHHTNTYFYCSCREAVYCNKECQRIDWPR